jgi:hypothetical protein
MGDSEQPAPRPVWVRLAARQATQRGTALIQVRILVLLTGIMLAVGATASGSRSWLGEVTMFWGLISACLGACGAAWTWLAIRWVDRNSKWG